MAIEVKNEEILDKIEQADRILVGFGEEFDDAKSLRQSQKYVDGCEILKNAGYDWLIPAWNDFWREKQDCGNIASAIAKLTTLLDGKNVFIVSTSVNREVVVDGIRIVMPCGTGLKKQCIKGCKEVIRNLTEEDHKRLWQAFELLSNDNKACYGSFQELFWLGECPNCGESLVLNTIYTESYNENGYLEQWTQYTKWLQGTLNHQLLVLELGVGMQFPSVIRWPFEKAAFFNQKAFFCRVNEKLYQLTEELRGKGCGISMNAIDWLNQL